MPDTPDDPTIDCKPLPKHKVAVLTFVGLLVPVYVIPELLFRLFPDQKLIVTVIAVGAIVPIMTYVVMPALIWLFRVWLKQ